MFSGHQLFLCDARSCVFISWKLQLIMIVFLSAPGARTIQPFHFSNTFLISSFSIDVSFNDFKIAAGVFVSPVLDKRQCDHSLHVLALICPVCLRLVSEIVICCLGSFFNRIQEKSYAYINIVFEPLNTPEGIFLQISFMFH